MTFFDLILEGKLEEIKQRVEADSTLISRKNDKGFPPLIMACYVDQSETAEFLLSKGVEINVRDGAGNTALMGVSFKGNLAIAELLIEKGADVNSQNYKGATALIYAVIFSQIKMAELLLRHGADKTIKDESGKTALEHAEFKGISDLVNILKE